MHSYLPLLPKEREEIWYLRKVLNWSNLENIIYKEIEVVKPLLSIWDLKACQWSRTDAMRVWSLRFSIIPHLVCGGTLMKLLKLCEFCCLQNKRRKERQSCTQIKYSATPLPSFMSLYSTSSSLYHYPFRIFYLCSNSLFSLVLLSYPHWISGSFSQLSSHDTSKGRALLVLFPLLDCPSPR